MAWQLIENRNPVGQQEIKVKMLLKEMAEYTYATYAEQFENHFKQLVKDIPRTNSFSAENAFKVKAKGMKSVEVWKMKLDGDYNYKMYTLNFIAD